MNLAASLVDVVSHSAMRAARELMLNSINNSY